MFPEPDFGNALQLYIHLYPAKTPHGFNSGMRGDQCPPPWGPPQNTLDISQGERLKKEAGSPPLKRQGSRYNPQQHSLGADGLPLTQWACEGIPLTSAPVAALILISISSEAPHCPESPCASQEPADQRGRRISQGHTAGRQRSWASSCHTLHTDSHERFHFLALHLHIFLLPPNSLPLPTALASLPRSFRGWT